jgi:intracellular multiplication protein IcmJ
MTFQQDSRSNVALDEEAVRNAGVSWDDATEGTPRPTDQLGANFATRRYRDIHFSVKRKIWRQDDHGMESADAEYRAKRDAVLAKGAGKCVFCGFRSKHTEVHHCNDNHADNRDENLAIADPLCHGTQHIGQVGSQRQGLFVHLDGLPQSEINHLQRTIAVVLETGTDQEKAEANALLQHLASRAEIIAREWGSANPSDFANAMLRLQDEDFDNRISAFSGMALLYKPARFMEYIGRWIDESYRSLPISTWGQIYDRARARR